MNSVIPTQTSGQPSVIEEFSAERLIADVTATQREAVTHDDGPLLIIAGAGTGKTTVITRRIAWLIATQRAKADEILALTFTDKAAAEMEERVDVLLPYGYLDVAINTFHAFGDRLVRDHAIDLGLSPQARVLSRAEQAVFLKRHLFDVPLKRFRPANDPARYIDPLLTLLSRAKDEAVTPAEFSALAHRLDREAGANPDQPELREKTEQVRELGEFYAAYQQLLFAEQSLDFGDQVMLAIQLFEQHPQILESYRKRFRYILVDEFQDTNYAQFRLLQLLATPASHVTVVADDDQSIYKWRGAAISNVLKFLEHYRHVRRIVLTENFRSSQIILDTAYRLIRHNDPDRLEVREQIDKRLIARASRESVDPRLAVFDTASSEADWVARQIQAEVEKGTRRPGDFAILVRTNREADLFLRALNICGVPWQFSGASGLFSSEPVKMLLSCLRALADPEDSTSWYHVISSSLYSCPMDDLVKCLAAARRNNLSLRQVFERALAGGDGAVEIAEPARQIIARLLTDVRTLLDLSRTQSPGQLLYRWLTDTGWLKQHAASDGADSRDGIKAAAQFFDQLYRFEAAGASRLPELIESLAQFRATAETPLDGGEAISRDRVNVLTIHKAKGLEFPVVFLVGLVQGRFPTPQRRETIELPPELIKDILPAGDYHLQEERRLFYVGMTRTQEQLYLTAAYDYGGKSIRKLSQFVLEALNLLTPAPPAIVASIEERLERGRPPKALPPSARIESPSEPLRLDAHGVDDYLTCPWKFRYSHVLRVPILRHHLVIYGSALHKAVELFFRQQLNGRPMTLPELLQAFEQAWSSEGFLSREHEQQRLAQGRDVLRRFDEQQRRQPETPSLIEEKFMFHLDDFVVVGRWDRVDQRGDEAVIVDYKSSDVDEQKQADRRARESLQMGVYALAWRTIHGRLPSASELRFLETGLTGKTSPTEEDLEKTRQQLRTAAAGIRAGEFRATPSEFACKWCAYQAICPFSAV